MHYRPLVLVDCDGVLADYVGAFLRMMREHHGATYERHQVTAFDFSSLQHWHTVGPMAWPLTKREGFCRDIAPLPGAVEGFRRLREIVDVEICTTATDSLHWVHERNEWLAKHFDVSRKDIHYTHKKHRIDAAALIDDSGENLDLWAQHRPDSMALLWDATYNRAFKHERVASWDALIDIVKHRIGGK